MVTVEELKRYQRQILVDGWGESGQERIKQANIFVAGAGGLGSAVLLYLAAAGIGTLKICDCDTVALSNLNRQVLYSHQCIGMPKVESARNALKLTNPYTNIIQLDRKITQANAEDLIGNADLVIDCLDNHETRHVLNMVSVSNHIPMIHAGVTGFRGQITFLHPPETACLGCFSAPGHTEPKELPIVGCTAGILGTLQAMEALKYLTGIGKVLKNELLFFDGLTMQFQIMELDKNPECTVCGEGALPEK
jgi:molybdopterin-synthase adenylyltransferase